MFHLLKDEIIGGTPPTEAERRVVSDFLFLCSFFEANVINSTMSISSLKVIATNWTTQGILDEKMFAASFKDFKKHFFYGSKPIPESGFYSILSTDQSTLEFAIGVFQSKKANTIDNLLALVLMITGLRRYIFNAKTLPYELQNLMRIIRVSNEILRTCLTMAGLNSDYNLDSLLYLRTHYLYGEVKQ